MRDGDDSAQMLLLTAVVLLAAFLAMSVLIIRAQQVESSVAALPNDPFMSHLEATQRGIGQVVSRLNAATALTSSNLQDALRGMIHLEAAQGNSFAFTVVACPVAPSTAPLQIDFTLSDGATRVTERFESALRCT